MLRLVFSFFTVNENLKSDKISFIRKVIYLIFFFLKRKVTRKEILIHNTVKRQI